MRIKFPALTVGLMLFTLALFCASQNARSDECGSGIPVPDLTVSSVNGQPEPKSLDLQAQRMNGAAIDVTIDFDVVRRIDWCMRGYFGPLTFTWPNLPEGVTATFDPATLGAHTDYKVQKGILRLSIPASVPDGTFPLNIEANENHVRVPPFRMVLSTKPN